MRGIQLLSRLGRSATLGHSHKLRRFAASTETSPGYLAVVQPGTVSELSQHVFIRGPSSGDATEHPAWPDVVEREEPILQAFKAIAQNKSDISGVVRVSAFDTTTPSQQPDDSCEVLIFPAGARFEGLPFSLVGKAVSLHTVDNPADNDDPLLDQLEEDVSDQIYLFVCCHGSRDRRCGVIGPPLCAALEQHIAKVGLEGKAHVRMCSHIGGHKYAGNVLVYGAKSTADGDWYGGLKAQDAASFLDALMELPLGSHGGVSSDALRPYWRGALGLSKQEQLDWFANRGAVASDPDDNDGDSPSESDWSSSEESTSEGTSDDVSTDGSSSSASNRGSGSSSASDALSEQGPSSSRARQASLRDANPCACMQ